MTGHMKHETIRRHSKVSALPEEVRIGGPPGPGGRPHLRRDRGPPPPARGGGDHRARGGPRQVVNHCLEAEAQGRRARWVILSRGERQAREAIEEGVKRHLSAFEKAFQSLEYDFEGQ